jgi:deoxyribose-phosphate aldolase
VSGERDRLVDLITEKVIAALRARGNEVKPAGADDPGRGAAAAPDAPRAATPAEAAAAMRAPAHAYSAAPPASASAPDPHVHADHDPETCERCRNWGVSAVRTPEETRVLAAAGASRVVATVGYCPAQDGLASMIDHTLLKPEASREDVEKLCLEALQFCFASVCVNPNWVALCAERLRDSGVKVCTVVGFPLGAHLPDVKAFETRRAVEQGAQEVDMVVNVGALKSKDYRLVEEDIRGVVQSAGRDRVVKVILETALLDRDEKVMGASLAKAAGADFVKTSTGFGPGGATVEDVKLLREVVGPEIGVKASGGIRTQEDAQAMIAAGATRIGASASVKIVRGEATVAKGY